MNKTLQKQLKGELIKEKKRLTKQLESFAKKNPNIEGDWKTNFPSFGHHRSEQDENADEVEKYENMLPIEYALEKKLQKVNQALNRIEKGTYGKCQNCQKNIETKRLKVAPEAELCLKCKEGEQK